MGPERTPLLEVLRCGRVLLMDGAMGTELQRVGLKPGENSAAWNFLHPQKVRAVHQAYLAAGAEVLLTNTFLVNALHAPRIEARSASEGMQARSASEGSRPPSLALRAFISRRLVWQRALENTGQDPVYRLAAVGPVAGTAGQGEFADWEQFWVPDCSPSDDPRGQHSPDAILLETCRTPRVRLALRRLRESRVPLLFSLSFARDERGRLQAGGHSPEWYARRARAYGAAALGANCGQDVGMAEVVEIIRRYRQETDLPLFTRPNAGTPVRRGGRWVYPVTPEEMAERLPELLAAGVSMVGGCCGTTPAHIAAFRKVVDEWNRR
jgi:methionine synthase I (cobalamin-dependent)